MSNLKFLFLADLNPSRKSFFCLSLKLGIQTFSLLTFFLLIFGFVMEYLYTEKKFLIIIKHLTYSLPLIISCFFLFKSTKELKYFDAYVGYLILCWNFVYHLLCVIFNFSFGFQFSALKLYGNFIQNQLAILWFPQIFLIVYEIYFVWVCYSYTKNLSEGNDALVDGQNFDKYYENFASVNSTPKKTERSFPLGQINLRQNLNQSNL
jgi:hypothetical protein